MRQELPLPRGWPHAQNTALSRGSAILPEATRCGKHMVHVPSPPHGHHFHQEAPPPGHLRVNTCSKIPVSYHRCPMTCNIAQTTKHVTITRVYWCNRTKPPAERADVKLHNCNEVTPINMCQQTLINMTTTRNINSSTMYVCVCVCDKARLFLYRPGSAGMLHLDADNRAVLKAPWKQENITALRATSGWMYEVTSGVIRATWLWETNLTCALSGAPSVTESNFYARIPIKP